MRDQWCVRSYKYLSIRPSVRLLTGSSKVKLLKSRDELPVYLSEARQFGGSKQQAAH